MMVKGSLGSVRQETDMNKEYGWLQEKIQDQIASDYNKDIMNTREKIGRISCRTFHVKKWYLLDTIRKLCNTEIFTT